ncbi:MAG: 5-(carboxyamino)imidazole ribonucleotide synthase [Ichthyobacteriaceae bacterium]|nr:5-(carboxyamino)imidazole ribonucleotide synthase [Ichthyobacteriaceae bacterium]
MNNKNIFSSDFTLGILGGGQLGKMLLAVTRTWDIKTKVLDPSAEAPGRLAANEFQQGSLTDFDTVYNFGKNVDVLTIEIENVNVEALKKLQAEGVEVHPKPEVLEIIQNKAIQKQYYYDNNIPTAPFAKFNNIAELKLAIENKSLEFPFVWKSTQFGYDGMGVSVIKNASQLDLLNDGECIAEDLIPFKNELAVIVATSPDGNSVSYPVVEMEFHPTANQVEYVICPARIEEEVAEKARKIAIDTAKKLGSTGLLAVEMFQTKNNDVIVNEVAPRPHNSGHYSIEASYTSQYEQHIRAILNLPLGKTDSKVGGVMVNLVGEEGYTGDVVYDGIAEIMSMPGVTPHIYGKRETRPFRKMGHVTIVDNDIDKAREVAEKVKQTIRVVA